MKAYRSFVKSVRWSGMICWDVKMEEITVRGGEKAVKSSGETLQTNFDRRVSGDHRETTVTTIRGDENNLLWLNKTM